MDKFTTMKVNSMINDYLYYRNLYIINMHLVKKKKETHHINGGSKVKKKDTHF